MNKNIEFTPSSGNVFRDLELENAEELLAKSSLAIKIRELIKKRGLTQVAAAKLLNTHQTQIARLTNSENISGMSIDLLLNWLTKLDQNVTIKISTARGQQLHGSIRIAN